KAKSNSEASAESEAVAPLASLPDTSGFDAAWFMYTSTGIPVNEQDHERAAKAWVVKNCDECVDAVLAALNEHLSECADLVRNHEWRKIGDLARWLERTPWTRRPAAPQAEAPDPPKCPRCLDTGVVFAGDSLEDLREESCDCAAGVALAQKAVSA
ncbi:MAG TPA: hypothetical protein PLZ95_07740, partial [Bryobacteraceae bacterium]|nr:hypothetical protein [Bryobacteraceae bacterium]